MKQTNICRRAKLVDVGDSFPDPKRSPLHPSTHVSLSVTCERSAIYSVPMSHMWSTRDCCETLYGCSRPAPSQVAAGDLHREWIFPEIPRLTRIHHGRKNSTIGGRYLVHELLAGSRGHTPPIFWFVGTSMRISSNIITYIRFCTSEFTKTCHFEITKQKKFWGGGTAPSQTPHTSALSSPTLNSRWRHWIGQRLTWVE